jgi:hypothetical protein
VIEAFLDEHPGAWRPDELAAVFAGILTPSAVAEVVAYLLASGRAGIDDDGCLFRRRSGWEERHSPT